MIWFREIGEAGSLMLSHFILKDGHFLAVIMGLLMMRIGCETEKARGGLRFAWEW